MDDDKRTMLIHRAITAGDLKTVKIQLENDKAWLHKVTFFGTWLNDASTHGKVEIAQWLISSGVDINQRSGTGNLPAIANAAGFGHVDLVKLLLDSGVELDVSESVGNPLISAIVGGVSEAHTNIAKLLIDHGIDVTVRYPNLQNANAREWAIRWGRKDIVKLLEKRERELEIIGD